VKFVTGKVQGNSTVTAFNALKVQLNQGGMHDS